MVYEISEPERKRAKHPHEIFLINLVTNHILVFVGLLGMAKSYPWALLAVPGLSLLILGYLLLRAKRAQSVDPWFVNCHWQVCAKRSRAFIIMIIVMVAVISLALLVSGGNLKPQHYALAGVGVLPTMVTVLALIMMESDAMHQAATGQLPGWMAERVPNPAAASADS